jgi:hypothetical protein
MTRSLPILLALSLPACGDKEPGDDTGELAGEPIDCSWFEGENCWKEQVASAAACAAPEGFGTFNADYTICSYADGTEVHFDSPAPAAGSPTEDEFFDYLWSFEIFVGGTSCTSYTTGEATWSLETPDGVFTALTQSGTTQYTCPAGDQYTIGAMAAFTDCDWGSLPSYVATSGSSLMFALSGTDDHVILFSCEGPAR